MHPCQNPRRLATSVVFAALASLAAPSSSARDTRIDCGAIHDIASQAYTEIRSAIADKDYPSAYRLKNVFWGIEKYGSSCRSVRAMAKTLSERRLGARDVYRAGPEIGSVNYYSPATYDGPLVTVENPAGVSDGTAGGHSSSGSTGTTATTGTPAATTQPAGR